MSQKRSNTHDTATSAKYADAACCMANQLLKQIVKLAQKPNLTDADRGTIVKGVITVAYILGVSDTHRRYAVQANPKYPTGDDRLRIGISAAAGSILGALVGMLFTIAGVVSGAGLGVFVLPLLGSVGGGAAGAAFAAKRGRRARPAAAAGIGGMGGPVLSGVAAGALANPHTRKLRNRLLK